MPRQMLRSKSSLLELYTELEKACWETQNNTNKYHTKGTSRPEVLQKHPREAVPGGRPQHLSS